MDIKTSLKKKYIPEKLIDRPKMGFGVPIDSWLRTDLKDWASYLLSDEVFKKYNFLKSSIIQERWKNHLRGKELPISTLECTHASFLGWYI